MSAGEPSGTKTRQNHRRIGTHILPISWSFSRPECSPGASGSGESDGRFVHPKLRRLSTDVADLHAMQHQTPTFAPGEASNAALIHLAQREPYDSPRGSPAYRQSRGKRFLISDPSSQAAAASPSLASDAVWARINFSPLDLPADARTYVAVHIGPSASSEGEGGGRSCCTVCVCQTLS